MSWDQEFFDPIILLGPKQPLRTLRDAARYITKLPKAEHDADEWQAAMEALLLVAELDGPPMFARIGIMRALNRGHVREFDSSKGSSLGEAEIEARSMTDNPRKGTMDGYRCEPCGAWVEYRDLGKVLAHEGPLPHDAPGISSMSDLQSSPPRAAQRPRCPRCQARSTVQRVVPARPGFEHWTLRCMKCGHIHEAQVKVDPK